MAGILQSSSQSVKSVADKSNRKLPISFLAFESWYSENGRICSEKPLLPILKKLFPLRYWLDMLHENLHQQLLTCGGFFRFKMFAIEFWHWNPLIYRMPNTSVMLLKLLTLIFEFFFISTGSICSMKVSLNNFL